MKSLLFPAGGCTGAINDGSRYCTASTSEPPAVLRYFWLSTGHHVIEDIKALVTIWAAFPNIHPEALVEIHSATQVRTVGP
jgi:hypothetical protein